MAFLQLAKSPGFIKAQRDLQARIDLGEFPDDPPECEHCDGHGNLIDETGARVCPHCLVKRLDPVVEHKLSSLIRRAGKTYEKAIRADKNGLLDYTRKPMIAADRFLSGIAMERSELMCSHGLLMTGSPGSGKTTAALYALGRIIRFAPLATMEIWGNFQDLIRAEYLGDPRAKIHYHSRHHLRKQIDKADVIFLDDVGNATWPTNEWRALANSLLWKVLDRGVRCGTPIILCSNFSRSDLANKVLYADASRSRLNSPFWSTVWADDEDMRGG